VGGRLVTMLDVAALAVRMTEQGGSDEPG